MSVDNPMTSYCLGDIVSLSQGLPINVKTKHLLVDKGLPLLRITDLINSMYSQFINTDEVPLKCVATEDEIIYTRTGQVGLVFRGVSGVVHNNCFKVIPNKDLVDPNYLYWFLSQSHIKEYANNIASGSVQKDLNHSAFKSIQIDLPPLDIQRKIYPILDSLSNKIALNRQINHTLEAMAQAIFKSWFVDFEPVKAKIAAIEAGEDAEGVTRAAMRAISGKTDEELDQLQAEQPDNYTQLKTTAELFPAAMQDSEFGEVPEGWTWRRADETCDISIGKTPPRKESQWFSSFPDGLKWISIRDMGECGVFVLDTSETLTHNAVKKFNVKKVPDNTLILSFKLTVGRVAITSGEMLTNEAIAHFIQKIGTNIPTSFYYLYLKQFDYNSLGSTSSIATAVNSKTIKALPIINPLEDVVGRFDAIIEPLFSQIKVVEKQNRELSQLRDTLLPKLLSGELSVGTSELMGE
ncbi:Type I restriction-modification system, specificity subunit S [Methanosarcina mazei C16]|uniref:Type I restriction-modification system, specificity subunit S n=1 Tax=Methanosarcina mazei C16 TaxID=1434113 RepID=A0A0E3RWQ7_METMZ|nr:restriction endonuclease subunit S [Methanosarcina mazei]AKB70752.1 Type I restriction-modification system, specificity subunit S [Methanosarcina mazei C16]